MKYSAKRTITFILILILSTFTGIQAQSTLVQNGFGVVTTTGIDSGAATLKVVNIRQLGAAWTMGQFAPADSSGSMPLVQTWTRPGFQNQAVRGLAVSGDGKIIYVSTHFHQPSTPDRTPRIYKIGPTFTIPAVPALLATLPGSLGVGMIDLDETHQLIFASNIDDGKIYRVNASTGAIIDNFDPLNADAGGNGTLPPLGERIIAVAYHKLENRIYYGVWGGGANTIRSIGLDVSGAFLPATDRLEVTLLTNNSPAGDIEFNLSGNRMLVAEDPLSDNITTIGLSAHSGRGLEYIGGTSAWTIDPVTYQTTGKKYNIGGVFTATNARGGAAWGYASMTLGGFIGNEQFVLFTGDALRLDGGGAVYGLQFTPATGGSAGGSSTSNSVIADLDYNIVDQDKTVYGDIDIRKTLTPTSGEVVIGGQVTNADGFGIGNVSLTLIERDGNPTTVTTNPFGYFQFDGVEVGQTVIVTAESKLYTFVEPTRVFVVENDITDLNFIAEN